MAYEKYSTDALVCGSFLRNTSDKTYRLFTREAGMVHAVAASVREERSKQRFALQDFSLVRVSLVQGKTGWRVTGVEPRCNPFMEAHSRAQRAFIHNVVQFVRRFVQGEEAQAEIFDEVATVLLESSHESAALDDLYDVVVFRLLHQLGYVERTSEVSGILEASSSHEASDSLTDAVRHKLAKAVERGYAESHL